MIFNTKNGTKISVLEIDTKQDVAWVCAYPDNEDKSFLTHIKASDIKEAIERVDNP